MKHSVPEDPQSPVSPPRRRRRTRAKRQRERENLEATTRQDVNVLLAEAHEQLPRAQADAVGAIYLRYSTEFQSSVVDQARQLLEFAVTNNIFVPAECVFFDLGVSGGKQRRPGLTALTALLQTEEAQVLLCFNTNRLFRRMHQSVQFVDTAVNEWDIRCIFPTQAIDTANQERWEMLLQVHSLIDDVSRTQYAENVRAAHISLFHQGFVFGTLPLGYRGDPTEDASAGGKPRQQIVVDDFEAAYVQKIFHWYVEDRLPLGQIARFLNDDPDTPLPAKTPIDEWTANAVRSTLTNERYRGMWRYGSKESKLLPSKDYVKQRDRSKPLAEEQFEERRIVSDGLWFGAQERLANENRNGGRKPKQSRDWPQSRLLSGLFWCSGHDRPLQMSGEYLHCPSCRRQSHPKRCLTSVLNRELALRLTCEMLASLIRDDALLVEKIVGYCREYARMMQQSGPRETEGLQQEADRLQRSIDFATRMAGDPEADHDSLAQQVRQLASERRQLLVKIDGIKRAAGKPIQVPTEAEVRNQLESLSGIFIGAASGVPEDHEGRVRALLSTLTGGRIDLYQCGSRERKKGWLEGRFRPSIVSLVSERLLDRPQNPKQQSEVVIEYRVPEEEDPDVDRARQLFDQGKLLKVIAGELQVPVSRARKLVERSFEQEGLKMPDCTLRRKALKVKSAEPPLYQRIAEEVRFLWKEGLLLGEIADHVRCDRNTITKAINYWHTERGLPVPDGRTRRKSLARKTQPPPEPLAAGCDD